MTLHDNYLVVGSGSIAKRHITNLRASFPSAHVSCVSASGRILKTNETDAHDIHADLKSAINSRPYFAIVASPAPFHIIQAVELLDAGVPVLIEKPLASSAKLVLDSGCIDILKANVHRVDVAYNLRYLSSAPYMHKCLTERVVGSIHNVIAEVGQYLPDWRPQSDYRRGVSGQKKLGGGALLELSHEIDYLVWLFGKFNAVYCIATNSGALDIDVEDSVDALLINERGFSVNLHMDFLQRSPSRYCKVIGEKGTLVWDLLNNSVSLHKSATEIHKIFSDPSFDRNDTYINELLHFKSFVDGETEPQVGLAHAYYVLCVIDAMKASSTDRAVTYLKDIEL